MSVGGRHRRSEEPPLCKGWSFIYRIQWTTGSEVSLVLNGLRIANEPDYKNKKKQTYYQTGIKLFVIAVRVTPGSAPVRCC